MAPATTMSPRPRLPRVAVWAWSTALLFGVAGCTICPDPFDYSGPVPNGSAPQNDFRARSNGIAPTGGVPRPWPPVVQAEPQPADGPRVETTVAEADTTAVATESDGLILPAAAEAPQGDDDAPAPEAPVVEAPALEEILPPAEPARPAPDPAPSETPGWRPRD